MRIKDFVGEFGEIKGGLIYCSICKEGPFRPVGLYHHVTRRHLNEIRRISIDNAVAVVQHVKEFANNNNGEMVWTHFHVIVMPPDLQKEMSKNGFKLIARRKYKYYFKVSDDKECVYNARKAMIVCYRKDAYDLVKDLVAT